MNLTKKTFLIVLLGFFISISPFNIVEEGENVAWADSAKKIKPPKEKRRPSLSYQPQSTFQDPKYNSKVGVLDFRDKRIMKFHGGTDEFFSDPVLLTLNQILYFEIKASRLFQETVRIPIEPGEVLTRKRLQQIANEYGVNQLAIFDLTRFNLLREKVVKTKKGLDFQVKVLFGFVGQLIDAQTGTILWAEQINREVSTLNSTGKITGADYSANSIRALKNGFNDMKQLIDATGLRMKK
jgi:hypothetical protein